MTTTLADLGITAGTWNIDPSHSEITFKVRHLMSKVRGAFTAFSGSVVIGDDLASAKATAEVQTTSVDTRTPDRDAHLRSAEILDVEKYPTMTFNTTGVRVDGGDYLVDGTLTIRDTTLPVTLEVEFNGVGQDPWGGTRAGFTATTSISRKAYGVEFNIPLQGDKLALGDKIEITLEVQAVKA